MVQTCLPITCGHWPHRGNLKSPCLRQLVLQSLDPRRPGDDQNTGADPRGELVENRCLKCERGNQLYELSALNTQLASYRSIISGHLTVSSTSWPTCSLFWILLGKWGESPSVLRHPIFRQMWYLLSVNSWVSVSALGIEEPGYK